MKIVHLGIGIVPVPPGDVAAGREEYIFDLTKNLALLGNEVHVIDIRGGVEQGTKRKQSTVLFHTLWRPSLPFKPRLFFLQRYYDYIMYPVDTMQFVIFAMFSTIPLNRLLAGENIEIIHAHQRDTALAAVFINNLRGHKAEVLYTPQQVTSNLPKWLRRIIHLPEILALKWVDHVIALTPTFKKHLIAEYGLDPDKITPISGGGAAIDNIEQFLSLKSEQNSTTTIILCTGMICKRKNQFTALKAIAKVVKTNPEVKLVFTGKIGEAAYYKDIQDYIVENKLSDFVEFKGVVPKQELYKLYSSASVFLFPTTAEVRPAVIVEALAFGLPIIASNIRANRDLLLKKGCALLLDPQDIDGIATAVKMLLKDVNLRRSMSEKAAELAQSMSYAQVARETMIVYEKLVSVES